MKVRNSELTVQAEILRVLRKLPKMKPAIHEGNNVAVLCSIIVKYGNGIEVDVVYIPERPIGQNLGISSSVCFTINYTKNETSC